MNFNSKDKKGKLPFAEENTNSHEDSRLERVFSAPPQTDCYFSTEESSPFSFILTKEDGTPLEIVSSEEDNDEINTEVKIGNPSESESDKSKDTPKDSIKTSINIETPLSDIESNRPLDKINNNDSQPSKMADEVYNKTMPILSTEPYNNLKTLEDAHSLSDKSDKELHMLKGLNKTMPNLNEVERVEGWEHEMESEGVEPTNEFTKFMAIEKLIGEFTDESGELHRKNVMKISEIKERVLVDLNFVYKNGEEDIKSKTENASLNDIKSRISELDLEKTSVTKNKTPPSDSNCLTSLNSTKQEAKITDEAWDFEFESDEQQNLSEFVKFMQIEKLISQFPEIVTTNILEKIQAILQITERTTVDVKFVKGKNYEKAVIDNCTTKINNLKNKVHSSLESIRIEFNRATGSNVDTVIENIKKIKVEKIDEMKMIASFVFEKVISEPIYFDIYLRIIGELRSYQWKCKEEQNMEQKLQTCFFGSLLSFAKKRLESEHDWFAQVDEATLNYTNRGDLEEQIENKLAEKNRKREHALGTVNFLVSLYIRNITGITNAQMVIDRLLSNNSSEHIVMVCYIYKSLIEKLISCNRTDMGNRIIEYLKANEKTPDLRLQVVIEKALKHTPNNNNVRNQNNSASTKSQVKNTFEGLDTFESESEVSVKTDADVLHAYFSNLTTVVTSLYDESEVLEYGDKIYKDVDRFANKAFFTAYLIEMVINYKACARLLDIFLKKLISKVVDLTGVIEGLREEMEMLIIDAACSARNYAELICHLRALNKISVVEYNSYKLPNHTKDSTNLFRKWKEAQDPKLGIVASEEEIQKLN